MICSYHAHERNWCQVILVSELPINLKNSYLSEHGLKILHEYGDVTAIDISIDGERADEHAPDPAVSHDI